MRLSLFTLATLAMAAFLALAHAPQRALAYGAQGHMVVAQIAYNEMSKANQALADEYSQLMGDHMDHEKSPWTFVQSAVWLDLLKQENAPLFSNWHVLDTPYVQPGTNESLIEIPPKLELNNIVYALEMSNATLFDTKCSAYHFACGRSHIPRRLSKNAHHSSSWSRSFSMRLMVHLMGDLHAPLHNIDRFSALHPHGDIGGNAFAIKSKLHWVRNIHSFWDDGAGMLMPMGFPLSEKDKSTLMSKAKAFTAEFPRNNTDIAARMKSAPVGAPLAFSKWSNVSMSLAIHDVYHGLKEDSKSPPTMTAAYTKMAQQVVKQEVAIAGYRLADIMIAAFKTFPALKKKKSTSMPAPSADSMLDDATRAQWGRRYKAVQDKYEASQTQLHTSQAALRDVTRELRRAQAQLKLQEQQERQ